MADRPATPEDELDVEGHGIRLSNDNETVIVDEDETAPEAG